MKGLLLLGGALLFLAYKTKQSISDAIDALEYNIQKFQLVWDIKKPLQIQLRLYMLIGNKTNQPLVFDSFEGSLIYNDRELSIVSTTEKVNLAPLTQSPLKLQFNISSLEAVNQLLDIYKTKKVTKEYKVKGTITAGPYKIPVDENVNFES